MCTVPPDWWRLVNSFLSALTKLLAFCAGTPPRGAAYAGREVDDRADIAAYVGSRARSAGACNAHHQAGSRLREHQAAPVDSRPRLEHETDSLQHDRQDGLELQ